MPLSEKTKNFLLAPFAISPIMQKAALPGMVGFVLFGVGFWQKLGWLKIVGIIFAAPVLWVYFVGTFIFIPMLVAGRIRRGKSRGKEQYNGRQGWEKEQGQGSETEDSEERAKGSEEAG